MQKLTHNALSIGTLINGIITLYGDAKDMTEIQKMNMVLFSVTLIQLTQAALYRFEHQICSS